MPRSFIRSRTLSLSPLHPPPRPRDVYARLKANRSKGEIGLDFRGRRARFQFFFPLLPCVDYALRPAGSREPRLRHRFIPFPRILFDARTTHRPFRPSLQPRHSRTRVSRDGAFSRVTRFSHGIPPRRQQISDDIQIHFVTVARAGQYLLFHDGEKGEPIRCDGRGRRESS